MSEKTLGIYNVFKDFSYFGIYIEAYTNQNNEVKKLTVSPVELYYKNIKHYYKKIYDRRVGGLIEPNGIAINCREISTIDVDIPEKCRILPKLKEDCKFYIETKKGYHFYFKKEDKLPRNERVGIVDINLNQLYFCPKYYHIETKEEYNYKPIITEELVDMPEYAIDWCLTLIDTKKDDNKEKIKKNIKQTENTIIKPDIIIEKFDIKTMNVIYEIFFNAGYFDDFPRWKNIAYMSRHLNNTEESFKLFYKWGKKVEKYKNENEIDIRRGFFSKGDYNINFDENGVLIKCSKLDLKKYKETLHHLFKSKYTDELILFEKQYIYPNDGSNDNIFEDWYKNFKILAIKSSYGTGKTYGFKKIIDKFKPHKILFITYRQSLAHSLSLELKEKYNFDNYLDNGKGSPPLDIKKSNRLIIQLDSIGKLSVENYNNIIVQKDLTPFYDLIILDELEGLLNHMSYDKIDQYLIYGQFESIINKSPKILALDGDMSDRSYDFLISVSESYKFYVNKYRPNIKEFIFSSNLDDFDEKMEEDMINSKKIVIVSMTKKDTEKYNEKYNKIYKVILHNSIEKNNDILLNVNEEWNKCDILIYSPSVESGVDFNIVNYFYKCYAVLSNLSTSYRAFNQMLNRVRYFENNEILCYIGKINWKTDDILYRFDEMKYSKYTSVKNCNLVTILVHNDVEKINTSNYFITSLLKLLVEKGHTYKYLDDKKLNGNESDKDIIKLLKENIYKAENIDTNKYNELLLKQQKNEELNREENNSILKFTYSLKFKISVELIDEIFMENHYNKLDLIDNLKIFNITNDKRKDKDENSYLLNFKYNKIDYLKNLLKFLGYTVDNYIITKNFDVDYDIKFKEEIKKVFNNKKFKTLFNTRKYIKDKNHLPLINEILGEYGLTIGKERHRKRNDKNKTEKDINNIDLKFLKIIDEYLERDKLLKENKHLNLFKKDETDNFCSCCINYDSMCKCDFQDIDLLNIFCICCTKLKCRCD
jgi:hypothetical protein